MIVYVLVESECIVWFSDGFCELIEFVFVGVGVYDVFGCEVDFEYIFFEY